MASAAANASIVFSTSSQNNSVCPSFTVDRNVCHGERIATSPTTKYMSCQKIRSPTMRTIVLRSDFLSSPINVALAAQAAIFPNA